MGQCRSTDAQDNVEIRSNEKAETAGSRSPDPSCSLENSVSKTDFGDQVEGEEDKEEQQEQQSLSVIRNKQEEKTEKTSVDPVELYEAFRKGVQQAANDRETPSNPSYTIRVPQRFGINDVFRDWNLSATKDAKEAPVEATNDNEAKEKEESFFFVEIDKDQQHANLKSCSDDILGSEDVDLALSSARSLLVSMRRMKANFVGTDPIDWNEDKSGDEGRDRLSDGGGPTREFLSQTWLQMGSLGVPVPVDCPKNAMQIAGKRLEVGQQVFVYDELTGASQVAKIIQTQEQPGAPRSRLYVVDYVTTGEWRVDRETEVIPSRQDALSRQKEDGVTLPAKTLLPAELFVKLFETTEGGFIPLENEELKREIARAIQMARGTSEVDAEAESMLMKRAKEYYRAVGRIMLHSFVRGAPISNVALPTLFREYVICGNSPHDITCIRDDVLKQLIEIGYSWLANSASMSNIGKSTIDQLLPSEEEEEEQVGKGTDFLEQEEEQVGKRTDFLELLKARVLRDRSQALNSLTEGFTLNGRLPVHEFLKKVPVDIISHRAFSLPRITAKDVIGALVPSYCDFDCEEMERNLFERTLPELLREAEAEECQFVAGYAGEQEVTGGFLRDFVAFCTGMTFLPSRDVDPRFYIEVEFMEYSCDSGEELNDDFLPQSHTCGNSLVLPSSAYGGDKELLKARLQTAFQYSNGAFGMA